MLCMFACLALPLQNKLLCYLLTCCVPSPYHRYMAIETEVGGIASVHNIGALSLETMPLKTSLKAEAASWKAQFANNLHKQCSEDLKAFDAYIR